MFLFAFTLVLPSAKAQTTTIDQLMSVIKTLQAQLNALRAAQSQVQVAAQNVQNTVDIARNLRQGMSGDDVAALQRLLASDPSVYPEGIISGHYGALTAKAVKAFQKKHGLEQAGEVGPKTRAFLHGLNLGFASTTATSTVVGEDDRGNPEEKQVMICEVPPGNPAARHTIFIGLSALNAHLRKGSYVGTCQGVTGTSTSDTLAPVITGVSASNITSSSTTITWGTNEAATTELRYATTTPVDLGNVNTVTASGFVTSHNLVLGGLNSSTTYHYYVRSGDAAGNTATSSEFTFTTTAQ